MPPTIHPDRGVVASWFPSCHGGQVPAGMRSPPVGYNAPSHHSVLLSSTVVSSVVPGAPLRHSYPSHPVIRRSSSHSSHHDSSSSRVSSNMGLYPLISYRPSCTDPDVDTAFDPLLLFELTTTSFSSSRAGCADSVSPTCSAASRATMSQRRWMSPFSISDESTVRCFPSAVMRLIAPVKKPRTDSLLGRNPAPAPRAMRSWKCSGERRCTPTTVQWLIFSQSPSPMAAVHQKLYLPHPWAAISRTR
mmetsp:Transcript_5107/g.10779  ORF Transcript_5107/g.10779 Transcript_5107/m.10779 type:complete len:247 (-) Transcript_5107:1286-2026(-)